MKKKILALILVLAMLLSCALMLTSCPGDQPDDTPGGDTSDPELNLDESLNAGTGSSAPSAITDPNNPNASGDEDKYIHDR
ncbi:MAG: hypothetical protein E7609_01790 [Ruminococcaceae bacterium]|nr:hypothetical protein [Oscillospiraceae bacterium]